MPGILVATFVLACTLCALPARAAWPEKPIRFIVPSAAGGSPDVLMRVMTNELGKQLGVTIVVDNKPGASFTMGTAEIARAAPDGYTIGYGNIVSLAVVQTLLDKVQMMFDNLSSIGPHAKSGRVRGIAVSGSRRSPVFPDLPTVAETIPGYETVAWGGVIAPAGPPKDVQARLYAEIRKALASPALIERYKALDTEIDGGTSEEFLALVRRETPKWAAVIRRANVKVD